MKSKFESFLLAVTTALLGVCLVVPARANVGLDASGAGDTVASVNGAVISRVQFDNALAYQVEMAGLRGVSIPDTQLPALKYQVVENLVSQLLLYQASQAYGIEVDKSEIDETFEAKKQQGSFATDAEFEEALKKSNKSLASYREEIKQGLAIDHFVQARFRDQTVVTDAEAKQYYDANPSYFQQPEQVRLRHILIRVASDAEPAEKDAARAKIEGIQKRLAAGEDFASLAGEVSDDPSTKDKGGDLGYLARGKAPQSFEAAAFALGRDETSDIVETAAGYHILKLTDRKDARTVGFEEAKSDIESLLENSKVNSSIDGYIIEMKTRSTIVTYPVAQ